MLPRKKRQPQRLVWKGGRIGGSPNRTMEGWARICRDAFCCNRLSSCLRRMRWSWTGQSGSGSYLSALTVGNSLLSQETAALLKYAQHPIASHFLDAALTSPSVPLKYRRRLISSFLGHFTSLAQDRLGSRVADTIWATADGYMRVSIEDNNSE